MNFQDLKKNSQSNLQKLTEELDKANRPNEGNSDSRFWKITLDKKAQVGKAVIRFLPAPAGEDIPWVRAYRHDFQGPSGDLYSEFSRTTIGESDPVGDLNRILWKSGDEDTARKQKRKTVYYSNILVISDPAHPENEGKVFLFRYGQKIFEKINTQMNPEFEHETPVNPFDFWNGCNFMMKVVMKDGFWNYDACKFDSPGLLLNASDSELEKIYNSEYSLKDVVQIKSYEELQDRLTRVLRKVDPMNVASRSTPTLSVRPRDTETEELEEEVRSIAAVADDDSDNLSYFARLASME